MKNLTKPISSPGRIPPLMRFLRSNVGNKSQRRRSRASHMFIKKKNTVINATQEPSSPKVTCIGQVRVRRSKKHKTTVSSAGAAVRRSNTFCRCFKKLNPRSFFAVLNKWVLFFRCGYCKDSCFFHDSPEKKQEQEKEQEQEQEQEKEQEHVTVEEVNEGEIIQPPPKNALLLTRCRSAPYRSSSLANKLLESTVEKTGEDELIEKIKKMEIKKDENEELNGGKEMPLILSRCKSEPATTWDQILV